MSTNEEMVTLGRCRYCQLQWPTRLLTGHENACPVKHMTKNDALALRDALIGETIKDLRAKIDDLNEQIGIASEIGVLFTDVAVTTRPWPHLHLTCSVAHQH